MQSVQLTNLEGRLLSSASYSLWQCLSLFLVSAGMRVNRLKPADGEVARLTSWLETGALPAAQHTDSRW